MSKGRAKAHPLIDAVIGQLPAAGAEFNTPARIAWLRMMAQAFDMAYGPDASIGVRLASDEPSYGGPTAGFDGSSPPLHIPLRSSAAAAPPKAAERKPHQVRGCDYYVDEQGYARCDFSSEDGIAVPTPGRRILADEAIGKDIYDYRGAARDRATVVWADETAGAQPGMTFCGPG